MTRNKTNILGKILSFCSAGRVVVLLLLLLVAVLFVLLLLSSLV